MASGARAVQLAAAGRGSGNDASEYGRSGVKSISRQQGIAYLESFLYCIVSLFTRACALALHQRPSNIELPSHRHTDSGMRHAPESSNDS